MTASRILVVDDTPFNRRLLVRLLEDIGHTAVEAEDGRQALDRLRDGRRRADRPRPAGHRHARDGRPRDARGAQGRRARCATCRSSSISGVDELDSVVRCIRMGAADYLPKTVDPEILRARIDASLAQKRLRDNERELLATIDRQRSQLARFLSPQVAALVSSADGEAMLAGHRREITAMFCDLRNFTAFSETAEPEEVLGFLRAYHAAMGALIVEHEGDARALRGRRLHDVLQRSRAPAGSRGAGDRHGRGDARAVRRAVGRLAPARPRPRDRDRHRDRLRDARPDRLRGPLRLRGDRQRDHPRRRASAARPRPGEILVAARTFAEAEADASIVAEPAGDRIAERLQPGRPDVRDHRPRDRGRGLDRTAEGAST